MYDDVLKKLGNKELTKGKIHQMVEHNFELIPVLVEGMSSQKANIRYGSGKILMDISEKYPEKVYPYVNSIMRLLDGKYRIIIWNSMAIVANIASVDTEKKLDTIFKKYFSFLKDEYMVTVANAIENLGKIAKAKPYLIQKITKKILEVENIKLTPHLTEECKKVIAEKAIGSFELFFDNIEDKNKVLSFVEKQVESSRKSLRSKAAEFVKKHCE